MADPIKRRKVKFEALALKPVEETTTEPSTAQKVAGDVTRTIGERASGILPLIARGGSGMLAFEGGPTGALISGGGEALAQMLEGKKWNDLNWGHIGVESGLGLIPGSKAFKAGKMLNSAVRGAGISAAGVVGRKAADVATGTDPNALNKENWSAWDALPVALGGVMSGAIGKMSAAAPKKAPVPTTPEGPQTIADFLGTKPTNSRDAGLRAQWNPDRIDREAARMEAMGYPEAARGLRVASAETNTGNTKIYTDVGKTDVAAAAQADKATSAERSTQRFEEHNVDRTRKEAERLAKERAAKTEADAALKAREEAIAAGAEAKTVVGESATAKTPEGTVRAATRYVIPEAEEGGSDAAASAGPRKRGPAPTAPPNAPTPVPGLFQVISEKTGTVVGTAKTIPEVDAISAKAGQGHYVILPSDYKAPAPKATPAAAPAPFNPPRMDVELPKAPVEPPVSPKVPEAPSEAPVASTTVPEAPPMTVGGRVVTDPATGGPLTAAPLAAAEEGPIPTLARIFRNLGQDDIQSFLQDVVGKYKAASNELPAEATMLPKAGQRAARDAMPKRQLGALLGNMKKELDLPDAPVKPTTLPEQLAAREPEAPVAPTAPPTGPKPSAVATTAGEYDLEEAIKSRIARAEEAGQQIPDAAPKAPVTPEVPTATTSTVPEDIIGDFSTRKANALAAAKTPEEAAQIEQVFQQEAERLQNSMIQDALAQARSKLGGESGAMSPELAQALLLRGAPAALGASVGAAVDDENRLRGAMLGGAAGLAGPAALKGIREGGISNMQLGPRLVNWQRGSLLSGPQNLLVNTAASTGGGNLSALEKMLQGLLEKAGVSAETGALEQGKAGLGALWSPDRLRSIPEDWQKASARLEHSGERADLATIQNPNVIDTVSQIPARIMTFGDDNVRSAFGRGGWSEAQARAATLTNEPRYDFFKQLTNFARAGGTAGRLALPFVKTAANVMESSLERTPVGLLMGMAKSGTDPQMQATLSEIVARQGMGAGVGAAAYILGRTIDPETAKSNKLSMTITNMTGQYGAIAAAAFAAGQASQSGKDQVEVGASKFIQGVPLPTTETFLEMAKAANSYRKGEPPNPNAEHLPQQWLPDSMLPRLLKDETINQVTDSLPKRRVTFEGLALP